MIVDANGNPLRKQQATEPVVLSLEPTESAVVCVSYVQPWHFSQIVFSGDDWQVTTDGFNLNSMLDKILFSSRAA